MVVSIVGVGAVVEATSTSGISVPLPTGLADDDVLILFASGRDQDFTTPSGWTSRGRITNGTSAAGMWSRRTYTSGVTAPSVVTTASSSSPVLLFIAAFRGVDLSSLSATGGVSSVGSTVTGASNIDVTGTAVRAPGSMALCFGAGSDDATWTPTPASWTQVQNDATATGGDANIVLYRRSYTSTGTSNTATIDQQQTLPAVAVQLALHEPSIVPVSAGLSGSGSLSAAVAGLTASRSAALGGSGTLSTTQRLAVSRAGGLSGSGTLAASVAPGSPLSGSGTLAAVPSLAAARSAALGGMGALAADTFGFVFAALSGSGALAAAQKVAGAQPATLSGSGSLSAGQVMFVVRAAALSGAGTLTTGQLLAVSRAAALTGSGTLLARVIYRLSWWTGSTWSRVVSKVWTGTSWDDVLVTVTDD